MLRFMTEAVLIIQRLHVLHVFDYHQCDLECDRIFKYTQIQSGTLLQLIQAVYQCISVDIQLSGCL